jgi:hypothetical protein
MFSNLIYCLIQKPLLSPLWIKAGQHVKLYL